MNRDLLVVGAGPAGVSAGLWAQEFGLDALVLESAPAPGGQLKHVHFAPRDVAGVRVGDGPAIASVYAAQLADAGVPLLCDCVATSLDGGGEGGRHPGVTLTTGETLRAEAVLIATGARRRRLDVPGERDLEGRGVSYSATLDRERFAGWAVAVVGGGDAAYENALILAEAGCDVTLLVRGIPRARAQFLGRVAAEPRIHVLERQRVLAFHGDGGLEGLRVADARGERDLPCAGVVIKAGVVPNSEWCRGALAQDPEGYLLVNERLATSAGRVWAAGDVRRPLLPSISVAMSEGAQAVAVIREVLQGR